MKNTKITLNSRYLKIGDKIIRTSGAYSSNALEILAKNSTHVKVKSPSNIIFVLSVEEDNDNWVRYNLD